MLRAGRVWMVGIGGSGMSGLARLLRARGMEVEGSDLLDGSALRALAAEGFSVATGHAEGRPDGGVDLLIHSAAVPQDDPERRLALERGVPELSYAEALGCLMAEGRGYAVAGAHGKTGAAALLAHALEATGRDPSAVIGGVPLGRPHNARAGKGPFVVEACEYRGSFLELFPEAALITCVDWDHPDCYRDAAAAGSAFRAFARRVAGPVFCLPDAAAALEGLPRLRVVDEDAVQVTRTGPKRVRYRMGAVEGEVPFFLPVPHALGHLALVAAFLVEVEGMEPREAFAACASFRGVRRRFEEVGEERGILVVDDYAHHPREIDATRLAAESLHPGRPILAVFQPHHEERTRVFMDAFAASLSRFPRLVLTDIYNVAGRGLPAPGLLEDLALRIEAAGGCVERIPDRNAVAARTAAMARPGELVLVMGAGDVEGAALEVVRKLR